MKIVNELKANLLARVSVRECFVLLFVWKMNFSHVIGSFCYSFQFQLFQDILLLLFGAD